MTAPGTRRSDSWTATRRWLVRLVLSMLCLFASTASRAVCISPVCSCNASTGNVAFGSYNPLTSSNVDSVGSVVVSCSGVAGLLVPYTVDISAGSGTYAQRTLASGANRINYNLFIDATRATVWGDGTAGSSHVTGGILLNALGTSPGISYPIYGRLPGLQTTAVPGSYVDTIIVTVTYN